MHWETVWAVIKDVALTGTGVAVIFSQVLSPHPSDVLLVTGLALTVPSVAGHAGALLTGRPGHTELRSSSPGPPSPSSSSPPSATTGEP